MKYLMASLFYFVCQAAFGAETLTLDPSHSILAFNWNHFGFARQAARFEKFEGKIVLDQADITKSSVSVRIPLTSVRTASEFLDRRLMKDEFFAASRFPDITFTSKEIVKGPDGRLKVTGDLSMRGVTRVVVLDAKINKIHPGSAEEPVRAGFEATTLLRRTDYGVDKYVPAVSDEIHVMISIEAFLDS